MLCLLYLPEKRMEQNTKTRMEFGYREGQERKQQQQQQLQSVRLFVKNCNEMDDQEANLAPHNSSAFASLCLCRICHEEEKQSTASMESPCACSGTLKFAHRECIQRWCDEKGSTVCEICLQNFEPGYTIPVKKALVEVAVTIRGSLEVPRQNYDAQNPGFVTDETEGSSNAACAPPSRRSAIWCRTAAIMLTAILLIRHFIAVVTVGADELAVLTVFLLRASGILLLCYLVLKFISAIQQAQWRNYLRQLQEENDSSINEVEEGSNIELVQHAIEIQT